MRTKISLKYITDIGKQIWWILLIGFIIRLVFAISVSPVLFSDPSWYYATATSLASGDGFSFEGKPTAYRTPGFSFIVSILFRIFGQHIKIVYVYNALIGVFILWLTGIIASFYTQKWKTVVLLLALYPEHILYTNVFATELTFQFFLLLWFLCKDKTIFDGIFIALSAYVRPVSLLLPVFFAIFDRNSRRKYIFAALIGAFLMSPWIIRNSHTIGNCSLSTNFWVNLWIGNGAQSDGGYFNPPDPPTDKETEAEKWFRKQLIDDLKDNPLHPIIILPLKAVHFWIPVLTPVSWALKGVVPRNFKIAIAVILTILNVVLLIFAAKPIIKRRAPREIVIIITYFWLVYMLFFGADRFRFPILPFLLILALL